MWEGNRFIIQHSGKIIGRVERLRYMGDVEYTAYFNGRILGNYISLDSAKRAVEIESRSSDE